MKKCLRCGQSYGDDTLNFCLNDGELLVDARGWEPPPTRYADDPPPTILIDRPRMTNPIDWPHSAPVQWQSQSPSSVPLGQYGVGQGQNTTLPMISLILGIISCFMVCCAGGIWLGLPAAVIGFIAMRNVDSNPLHYGGRGIAMGGLVLGIVTFLASVFFLIFR